MKAIEKLIMEFLGHVADGKLIIKNVNGAISAILGRTGLRKLATKMAEGSTIACT